MADIIEVIPKTQNSLGDFIEAFRCSKVTPGDDEGILAQANLLAGLHGNRDFIKHALIEKLEAMWGNEYRATATSQTVNLGDLGGGHYLRMVFWPSKDDEFYERCDNSLFYYGKPHDHNFSFLTLGYDGPGYLSDYYEILENTDNWHPGTPVKLRPTGQKQLENGQIMFYRRHLHVHSQHPPAQNSISLNIMGLPTPGKMGTQFIFDEKCEYVQQVMQSRFNPIIFDMAAAVDKEQTIEISKDIIRNTRDDYVRFYAQRFLLKNEIKIHEVQMLGVFEKNEKWLRSYARRSGISI